MFVVTSVAYQFSALLSCFFGLSRHPPYLVVARGRCYLCQMWSFWESGYLDDAVLTKHYRYLQQPRRQLDRTQLPIRPRADRAMRSGEVAGCWAFFWSSFFHLCDYSVIKIGTVKKAKGIFSYRRPPFCGISALSKLPWCRCPCFLPSIVRARRGSPWCGGIV